MIKRSADCIVNGQVSRDALISCIVQHEASCTRLNRLKEYTRREHEICKRVRPDNKPNNKLVHDFPRYIMTMASGYLVGSPVSYSSEADKAALEAITNQYARIKAQSIDMELARDASGCGRAVELLYADRNAKPRCAAVDPRVAFVVYDDTVEAVPIFGVHYYRKIKDNGTEGNFLVNVYTDTTVETYDVSEVGDLKTEMPISSKPHYFGGVPVNEYWNDEDEISDFEPVLSLIDAYNTLQSDRVNDKEQFVNAILVLIGCTMEKDANDRTPKQQLKEDGMLILPSMSGSGTVDARYLTQSLTESEVEVLKNSLKDDIHKLSMVPDLTDKNFATDASGQAMKFKLLGFEQLVKNKERWFREGLQDRLRMFANFMGKSGNPSLDVENVQITFTRSLPANEQELAGIVMQLQNVVPEEILLKLLPFIQDPKQAIEMMNRQREEQSKRDAAAFEKPVNTADGKLPSDDEGGDAGADVAE